jgi:hypothetical protein
LPMVGRDALMMAGVGAISWCSWSPTRSGSR